MSAWHRKYSRRLIPGFDGAVFPPAWKDAPWAKRSMGAPARQEAVRGAIRHSQARLRDRLTIPVDEGPQGVFRACQEAGAARAEKTRGTDPPGILSKLGVWDVPCDQGVSTPWTRIAAG
jgi:hypothetical protein